MGKLKVTDDHGNPIEVPGPFPTVGHVINRNREVGQHFFDTDTKRFFMSRIGTRTYDGRLFITSEKMPHSDMARGWTVRVARDDGTIGNIDPCGESSSMVHYDRGNAENGRGGHFKSLREAEKYVWQVLNDEEGM